LSDGAQGSLWSELLRADTAEVLTTYTDGPVHGAPATTVNRYGAGSAYYLSTRLDADNLGAVLRSVCAAAGVAAPVLVPEGVEVVRRRAGDVGYLFVINHTETEIEVDVTGTELLTGSAVSGLVVAAGGVAVVREA
jgi:beta-galactosidase